MDFLAEIAENAALASQQWGLGVRFDRLIGTNIAPWGENRTAPDGLVAVYQSRLIG